MVKKTTSPKKIDTGTLCLDLLATVGSRRSAHPRERLTSPDDLAEWLRTEHLATVDPGEIPQDWLEEFRTLREHIHELLDATVEERVCSPRTLDAINQAAAHGVPRLSSTDHGPRVGDEEADLTDLLGRIAHDAIQLLAGQRRSYLHRCEGETCDLVFIDSSPSGRRRWCSGQGCGNRARVASHRDRLAKA